MTLHTTLPATEASRISFLFAEGLSVREIAEQTKWPRHRVMAVIAGTARIGQSGLTEKQGLAAAKMRREGKSYAAIAAALKTTVYHVKNALDIYGDE